MESEGLIYGYTRTFSHDDRTFLIGEDGPETGAITYGRDAVGNMISRQVGSQAAVSLSYDGLNRLILTDYPDDTPDRVRSYDANGNLLSLANTNSQSTSTYDANDYLVAETRTMDGVAYTLAFAHDDNDALDVLTYPSGRTVTYKPDAFGRPTQAAPLITALAYHPSGQLAHITYANGLQTDITLTTRLWIERLRTYNDANPYNPSMLISRRYAYDETGNVSAINDELDGTNNRTFDYDGLNRLIGVSGAPWTTLAYLYDAQGNIRAKDIDATARTYSYSNQRLAAIVTPDGDTLFDYDERGNTTLISTYTEIGDPPQPWVRYKSLAYDAADRLRSASLYSNTPGGGTDLTFGYDGNGLRVSRSGPYGTEFRHSVVSKTGQLLGEYTPAGPLYGTEHIYVGTQRLVSVQRNQLPQADAGLDQVVDPGQSVTLHGSASQDPDGILTSFAWAQSAGPSVALQQPDHQEAQFTAPQVEEETTLEFTLTVTDNDGEQGSDSVSVRVQASSQPPPADLVVSDYVQLSRSRVNRYEYEYVYDAIVDNQGGPGINVTGTLMVPYPEGFTPIDAVLELGDIPAGGRCKTVFRSFKIDASPWPLTTSTGRSAPNKAQHGRTLHCQ